MARKSRSLDDLLSDDDFLDFMVILCRNGYAQLFHYMGDQNRLDKNEILERATNEERMPMRKILKEIEDSYSERIKGKENRYFRVSDDSYELSEDGILVRDRIKKLDLYEKLQLFYDCIQLQGAPQTHKVSVMNKIRIILYIDRNARHTTTDISRALSIDNRIVESYIRLLGIRRSLIGKKPLISIEKEDSFEYISPSNELKRFINETLMPVLKDFGYR